MPQPRFSINVAAICLSMSVSGCDVEPGSENNLEEAASNITNLVPLPDTPSTLDRASLLEVIGDATSAYTAGIDDAEAQRALVGRRFAFRMPFGCAGDGAPKDSPLRMTFRDDGKSYEARATYSIKVDDISLVAPEAGGTEGGKPLVETVEGFWVEQPWLLSEQCPAPPPLSRSVDKDDDETRPITTEHSIGLASFVTRSDSRVSSRAGRDYVKLVTLKDGEKPPPGMFLLVEGRLRAWPDEKVIHCRPAPSGNRPICIAGATIDRVAFERVDNRALVAEWGNQ